MTVEESELIEKLNEAERCRPDVESLSRIFAEIPVSIYESILKWLIEAANDKAIGLLLLVCGVNKVKLDPILLAESLRKVDNVIDFSFPYRYQDKDSIELLLDIALAEDISDERKALAGNLAAELIMKFKADPSPVKKVLLKLRQQMRTLQTIMIIDQSIELLSVSEEELETCNLIIEQDVLSQLPKRHIKTVASGSYTVKRPVKKIGRNQPCHCGSGKKYKKCCYEKDQLLLDDASAYEGLTKEQIKNAPELVDDTEVIDEMRAYELKKLDLHKLNRNQLLSVYQRSLTFGMLRFAFETLLELDKRFDEDDFDRGHFEDLLHETLNSGDLELSKEVEKYVPKDRPVDNDSIRFKYDLLEDKDKYRIMDKRCKIGITNESEYEPIDNPLTSLAFEFENFYPALSIVFARAAIINDPENYLDNNVLLDVIRNARIELDIELDSEPIEDLLDLFVNRNVLNNREADKAKEFEKLQNQISETGKQASNLVAELRRKENELANLSKKLQKQKEKSSTSATPVPELVKPETQGKSKDDLIQKIEYLKQEIRHQQAERRKLREEFKAEQKKNQIQMQVSQTSSDLNSQETSLADFDSPQKILIPEYSDSFKKRCASLPGKITEKALKAITGFAVWDRAILRKVKRIESKSNLFRIRISNDHRLMLLWEKNTCVRALDMINRADLETWLKQYV